MVASRFVVAQSDGRSAADLDQLVEEFANCLTQRWERGERPVAEEYLDRAPALWSAPTAALELVAEELALREEYDDPATQEDLVRRFPHWAEQVRALLVCHRAIGAGPAVRFPTVGELLEDFRLVSELGRGGYGRVYLATQPSLADRPVVVKLAPPLGDERLSLARLQHTHVVPLYSAHDFADLGLQGLCMPYLGGLTLAAALAAMEEKPARLRTGVDLLRALERAGAAAEVKVYEGGEARRFFARASYVRVVCWIGACLAEALHYAHQRGLLHLDLKPSNVLIAADGQPMLLDFHLAHEPLAAGAMAPKRLGGTPGWMAPEHEAALVAVRAGAPLTTAVDGRADVFALGRLLQEALGGVGVRGAPALRRSNSEVTPALAAVLDKCAAFDPAKRYTAAELAADLRRHLADQPLRGTAEPCWIERWAKWRRRRPLTLPAFGLSATMTAAAVLLFGYATREADRARESLRQGEAYLEQGRFAEAADAFRYGRARAEELPWEAGLVERLRAGSGRAQRSQAVAELHAVCERLQSLYGSDDGLTPGLAAELEEQCRRLWAVRTSLIDGRERPGVDEGLLRNDLLDLVLLWSQIRLRRVVAGENRQACEEALALLREAEALCGSSRALLLERARLERSLDRTDEAASTACAAAALPLRSVGDFLALGRASFHAGDVAAAEEAMDQALALKPDAFWPHFYKGKCALKRGRPGDAAAAFTACVALAPTAAWCYHNRGLAYLESGRPGLALADFDRALALDPGLASAALSRASLHRREGRHAAALADLKRARESGAAAAVVSFHEALTHLARDDRPSARACIAETLRCEPTHAEALALAAQLGLAR